MAQSRNYDELVEALVLAITAPEENEDDNKELIDYAEALAAQFDSETVSRAREDAKKRIKAMEERERE